jgi:hypothetical protein
VVFMHAQGIQELLAWNVGITEQALELYEQTTKVRMCKAWQEWHSLSWSTLACT